MGLHALFHSSVSRCFLLGFREHGQSDGSPAWTIVGVGQERSSGHGGVWRQRLQLVLNTDALSVMKADLGLKFQGFSHLNYISYSWDTFFKLPFEPRRMLLSVALLNHLVQSSWHFLRLWLHFLLLVLFLSQNSICEYWTGNLQFLKRKRPGVSVILWLERETWPFRIFQMCIKVFLFPYLYHVHQLHLWLIWVFLQLLVVETNNL